MLRHSTKVLAASFVLMATSMVGAEDIDLFVGDKPSSSSSYPNVLIILDNTANWNSYFTDEMAALQTVVNTFQTNGKVNVGLMMQTGTSTDGGYVRFGIRPMDTSTNRNALITLVNNITNTSDEKANNATGALNFYEAYLYFKGMTADAGRANPYYDWKGNTTTNTVAGTTYTKTSLLSDSYNAFTSSTATIYNRPPMDTCNKNYIIYISNGAFDNGTNETSGACTKLYNAAYADSTSATTAGKTTDATAATSTITFSSNNGETGTDCADEWSRYLYKTDLRSDLANTQNVISYAIDIDPKTTGQGPNHTQMMKSIANQGHGRYYSTASGNLAVVLEAIFAEIQAVNSVFASASLPVSVNVQGTYLNQVYMGVFRPDGDARPRWLGNLKQYKFIKDSSGNLVLGGLDGSNSSCDPTSSTNASSCFIGVANSTSGFVSPTIGSFWSTAEKYCTGSATGTCTNATQAASTGTGFWVTSPAGSGGAYDYPDGEYVEKGGAAQRLRSTYAYDTTSGTGTSAVAISSRKLYTCTGAVGGGTCAANALLSATPFSVSNSHLAPSNSTVQSTFGVSDATSATDLINWIRGADNVTSGTGMESASPGGSVKVRPSMHGDVLHSKPAVVNYGGSTGVVVFYGGNDGVFRAIKGGQTATDGTEKWGFVMPEFFGNFKRLRDNSPLVSYPNVSSSLTPTPQPKPYFADGPISVYTLDANGDGQYTSGSGDKVYLYVGMRRGGRFIYALDVTDSDNPKFLWKKGCKTTANPSSCDTGYNELGYTWSEAKVAKIKTSSGSKTVLIFGGGYDKNEDTDPPTTADTMGRGIFVVDASDGSVLWQAGPSPSGATFNKTVSGMTYAIPADVTVLDRDSDGYVDRIYAADLGGNVWRVDVNTFDLTGTTDTWVVSKLAALGTSSAPPRKFFYAPDVVLNSTYDAVLIGSGDREHPLVTNTGTSNNGAYNADNYFFMIRDLNTGVLTTASTVPASVTLSALDDGVNGTINPAHSGWYMQMRAGEKVVNKSVTVAGVTFFGTNQAIVADDTSCNYLGKAWAYGVYYDTAAGIYDSMGSQRYTLLEGGGLPPSPVAGVVDLGGTDGKQVFILGAPTKDTGLGGGGLGSGNPWDDIGGGGGGSSGSTYTGSSRIYWYNLID